jgi:hypothetical protein
MTHAFTYLLFFTFGCKYQSKTRDIVHLPHCCIMVWSYFGSGHGKGDHNGAGVVLKQEIRKEQMNMDSM